MDERRMIRRGRGEEGFALVLSLVMLTALTILGVSAVTTSSIDLKITRNLRLLEQARYASMAGGEHARREMLVGDMPGAAEVSYFGDDDMNDPAAWYIYDSSPDRPSNMLQVTSNHYGTYRVNMVWVSCGGPPAGFSLDQYHSSFFDLRSEGSLVYNDFTSAANAEVVTVSTMRQVLSGPCYMR